MTDPVYDYRPSRSLNYALHTNSRSWFVLFPSYPAGARNSWFFYDNARRMVWGRAGDYRDTPGRNEEFGFSGALGPYVGGQPSGEWLAPGFVGLRLLYSTPDSTGQATRVHGYGWSAADNSIDLSGPFTGLGTIEARYQVLANPAYATRFVRSSSDTTYMQRSRMWSLMSLGHWTILPGDSITVAIAEFVDGLDYSYAVDPATTPTVLGSRGSQVFFATADKAKFTYDQHRAGRGLNHPDPPPAPTFTVDYVQEREVGNLLQWGAGAEGILDPDDGLDDWLERKPADVTFAKVPAAFNPAAGLLARAFYALEALGEQERLNDDFFNALVNDRRRLVSEAAITGFVKQFGVDEARFREAFNSFAVDAKVRRAEQLGKRFKIDSVPKLVVADRQKTGDGLGSYVQMLAVTDVLIDESRKLRQPGTTTP